MAPSRSKWLRRALAPVLLAGAWGPVTAPATHAASLATQVALAGTSSPITGDAPESGSDDITQAEFAGQLDSTDGAGPNPGPAVDRSLSDGQGQNITTGNGPKSKSKPVLNRTFPGLNHYQQRYSRKGNQFSVEPPDQGLCVGNGYELEAVNDVLNVFNPSGGSVLPDNTATNIVSGFPRNVNHAVDLNSFYGYAPAINRSTGVRAQFVTDPSCLFDAATQRFFLVVLTLETHPTGGFTHVNHLDIAVSQTSNPAGLWNIYRVDVTNDGSNPDPSNACPCLGDYPHIGADANGFYVTTNAYPWLGNGFDGAQIYSFSKAQLAAGAGSVTMVHLDTFGAVSVPSDAGSTQPGFTVWPAQSPGTESFDDNAGGTELFLSSNAADEAKRPVAGTGGDYTSSQLVVWSLTNTSSLSSTPNLSLTNTVMTVNQYSIPPRQHQPGSGAAPDPTAPQGYCLNDSTTVTIAGTGCWRLLVSATAHSVGPEVVPSPDANDTRMQQVTYANGRLWGALDSNVNGRAGIAWFILNPDTAKVVLQGYLGAAGTDFTYPAIGVTPSGRGVMAFTETGDSQDPSAAYAGIDALAGIGTPTLITAGGSPDDGFSAYRQQNFPNPPRPRWGDYGAAAVDGNSVWIASESAATACSYIAWGGPFFAGGTGDNLLGTCGGSSHGPGVRTALANWATRITQLTP